MKLNKEDLIKDVILYELKQEAKKYKIIQTNNQAYKGLPLVEHSMGFLYSGFDKMKGRTILMKSIKSLILHLYTNFEGGEVEYTFDTLMIKDLKYIIREREGKEILSCYLLFLKEGEEVIIAPTAQEEAGGLNIKSMDSEEKSPS